MEEQLFFLTVPSSKHKLFIHVHCPRQSNNEAVFFLNPIIDEKKRVQKFQAETAREISKLNYYIVRFDYYGTGDSSGELYEFDPQKSLQDIEYLFEYFSRKYSIKTIKLFGIRFGADLAIIIAKRCEFIKVLYLFEPIIKGSRYLVEQRLRRKSFFSINNMKEAKELIIINSQKFEDHQGYPLSQDLLQFIGAVNSEGVDLKNKKIILFKTKTSFSQKAVVNLIDKLSIDNDFRIKLVNCASFWNTLETINTSSLTMSIVNEL